MPDIPGSTRRRPATATRGLVAVGVLLALVGAVAVALLMRSSDPEVPAEALTAQVPGEVIDPLEPPVCARTAAPGGDDEAAGTSAQPFGSVQRLVDSLEPGDTGCLAAGTYSGDVVITRGGESGRPITLAAAAPGVDRPTVEGRITVEDSANHVVIAGLTLNGRNSEKLPSPTINGDDVVLRNNEITNGNSGICINLGHESFGTAVGTVIEGNRIHHCGELPPNNLEHGVYVGTARDTLIQNNVIHANADRGIQLYPDAQRTRVVHNVIHGNGTGIIFSGADGTTSNDNYVGLNIISGSARYNVDAFWSASADGVGTGNVVEENCLWAAGVENVSDEPGFTATDNAIVDPEYLDPDRGVFRLAPDSACAGRGPTWENP
jgi:hypothetical protein